MSTSVLWATLGTLQKQDEFLLHKIENHPTMAAEYVRFLVSNSGLQQISSLEAANLSLKSTIKELTASLKSTEKDFSTMQRECTILVEKATKAATTANNKVDQLQRELDQLKSKVNILG